MTWTHSLTVAASPDAVWQVHTDLARLPQRTPTIDALEILDPGPLHLGQRVRITQPGRRPADWRVNALEPGRAFSWQVARPGLLMTGSHRVTPDGDGATSTVALELAGPLASIVRLIAARTAQRALAAENDGLRQAAEALEAHPAPVAQHAASPATTTD